MIKFVTGDFFDYEANIRINTVNCVGVMGAGVALLFKKKFPDMFKEYYKACKIGEIMPGKPHVWSQYDMFSDLTIINFPTKLDWRNPSEYEYIEKGLSWLRNYLKDKKEATVTLPALGCGHGGLDWEKVKGMIINYLGDLEVKILVFEPNSSTRINFDSENEDLLKNNNIQVLLPSNVLYPHKLVGRSATEIFYKGNVNLLNEKSIALFANTKSEIREKEALNKLINELPKDRFVFYLGFGNSVEIDLVKEVLQKGYKVVIFIPFGIFKLKVRNDLQSIWDYNNLLVLSITKPDQDWKRYESINMLKFRLKIANVMLINSLNVDNISRYGKDIMEANNQVFYINYWKNDINFYNTLKAQKIGINPVTLKPNISPILKSIDEIKDVQ